MARRSSSQPAGSSPLGILLPYQRDWVSDSNRFKIGLWARQTGKSFATAAESVTDCLARKTTWVTLSAGERQALEWMYKAREWTEVYKAAIEDYEEFRDSAEAVLKAAEIRWPNGSRLIAIPANPDTARGYAANLTLDEFAFHEQPDAIWRAIYPSISNPLRGLFRIRIVSTPNGIGNKFHDLWSSPRTFPAGSAELQAALDRGERGVWSAHKVDIHTAKARGLPVDIEELRAGLADPEGWAQEFECQFLDAAAVLLAYELIGTCESPDATETVPAAFWEPPAMGEPTVMGIDFGRKRNLTVAWTAVPVADLLITREVLCLQGMPTPDQVELLRPRVARARRVCLDYTGSGVGLGDYLMREFGEYRPDQDKWGRIEPCTFTQSFKVELWPKLRMAFEARQLRIPISRAIREDLHSMHRVATAQGSVTYRAPMTDDGHADRATALALCVRAGADPAKGAIRSMDGVRLARAKMRPRYLRPRKIL